MTSDSLDADEPGKPREQRAVVRARDGTNAQNFWIMSKPSIVCWLATPSS